ncbi:MAG: C40 family peptidase [Robiginitalea sp.]|nr:C40 family peptidase [Robiginitalea sp.]
MKRLFVILALLLATGCGVRKSTGDRETRSVHVEAGEKAVSGEASRIEEAPGPPAREEIDKAEAVVETALEYTGVRYKFGGTTRKGMDCSGLLYVSFLKNDIPLPRTSHLIAQEGKRIQVSQLQKGDLLFFKTRRGGKKINHAGLVVAVEADDVKFIHSTTSRGVIVSSLREGYWNYSFVKATRIF